MRRQSARVEVVLKYSIRGLVFRQLLKPCIRIDRPVHLLKGRPVPDMTGTSAVLNERPCIEIGLDFLVIEMELTKSLDSGLRRLLPKTSAHQHASHSLAPPSRSMQNLQVVDGIGAVDFAAGSVETYGLAQRKADPVRQASAAVQIMRRPSQEHQNARMETHSLGCQSALPPPTDAIFRNPANSRNIRAAFPMRHLENPNQPREYDTYDSQTPSESMLWNPDFFPGQPSSGGESSVPPSPKIHVTRVWKSEKRQNRFPKVAVACDNCR